MDAKGPIKRCRKHSENRVESMVFANWSKGKGKGRMSSSNSKTSYQIDLEERRPTGLRSGMKEIKEHQAVRREGELVRAGIEETIVPIASGS